MKATEINLEVRDESTKIMETIAEIVERGGVIERVNGIHRNVVTGVVKRVSGKVEAIYETGMVIVCNEGNVRVLAYPLDHNIKPNIPYEISYDCAGVEEKSDHEQKIVRDNVAFEWYMKMHGR